MESFTSSAPVYGAFAKDLVTSMPEVSSAQGISNGNAVPNTSPALSALKPPRLPPFPVPPIPPLKSGRKDSVASIEAASSTSSESPILSFSPLPSQVSEAKKTRRDSKTNLGARTSLGASSSTPLPTSSPTTPAPEAVVKPDAAPVRSIRIAYFVDPALSPFTLPDSEGCVLLKKSDGLYPDFFCNAVLYILKDPTLLKERVLPEKQMAMILVDGTPGKDAKARLMTMPKKKRPYPLLRDIFRAIARQM